MPQRFARRIGACVVAIGIVAACGSQDADVRKHREKLDSLRATTIAAVNAWLAGEASSAYTRTTLDQTFQLVDQERSAVAATPDDLARPKAMAAASNAEQLNRVLAALADAVRRGDGSSARSHLAELPRALETQQ